MKKTGLFVYVYRSSTGDSTNKGPTSKFDNFVIVDNRVEGPFTPNDANPEMNLVFRAFNGQEYVYAVPASLKDEQTMFGGNFVWTSDSRLNAVSPYPIPVHDRVETTIHFDGLPHESLR